MSCYSSLSFQSCVPFLSNNFNNLSSNSCRCKSTARRTFTSQIHLKPPPDPSTDQWAPENLGFLLVATITAPHGVHGELKLKTHSHFTSERLDPNGPQIHLLLPGRRYPRPIQLISSRSASDSWLVRLQGIKKREQATSLRGARLYVHTHHRPRLARGEFLVTDLIGCRVSLKQNQSNQSWASWTTRLHGDIYATSPIGIVSSVITRDDLCTASGAGKKNIDITNDLIEVASFQIHGEAAMLSSLFIGDIPDTATRSLVPFVKQIVPVVDVSKQVIVLDPPEGLLETTIVNNKQRPRPPRGLFPPATN